MGPGRHQVGRKGVALIAALLAVLLQSLVIQTHVDGLGGLGAAVAAQTSGSQASAPDVVKTASQHADVACPICQAAATAGRTLLTSSAILPLPPRTAQTDPIAAFIAVTARPSHAWRSRAPPLSL